MRRVTKKGDRVTLVFHAGEPDMLLLLLADLEAAIKRARPGQSRLAPVSANDKAVEKELNELLAPALAETRIKRINELRELLGGVAGGRLETGMREAEHLLAILTELRLMIGERIGVEDESWGRDLDPANPPSQETALYLYLTGIQSALLAKVFGVDQDPTWMQD